MRTALHIAGWIILAILLYATSRWAGLSTEAGLEAGPDGIIWTVAGSTIKTGHAIQDINQIQVVATDSIDPPGGKNITLSGDSGLIIKQDLPHRFAMPIGKVEPVGDWYIDRRAARAICFSADFEATDHIKIDAVLLGRSLESMTIAVQGSDVVHCSFRRGLINNDMMIADRSGRTIISGPLVVKPVQRLVALAGTACLCSCVACILIAVFIGIGSVGSWDRRALPSFDPTSQYVTTVVVVLATIASASSIWLAGDILEGLPHIPDSVTYLLQSRWLLDGKISTEVSPIQEHLPIPFTFTKEGRWMAQYAIGWPLILSLGSLCGAPWLVAPIIGFFFPILIFLVGRELYDTMTGLGAAVLAVISPMTTLMFGSHLSHAASSTLILVFMWLFWLARRKRSLWIIAIAGVALGFAFGIRPLTALAIAFPHSVILLFEFRQRTQRRFVISFISTLIIGGLLGAIPLMVSNLNVTGHALRFGYSLLNDDIYSFHNLPMGVRNIDTLITHTLPALFGWGWPKLPQELIFGLAGAFAVVPFLLTRQRRADVLLVVLFFGVVVVHLGTTMNGLHGFGPRYYFEVFFCVFLLTVRGFSELGAIDNKRNTGRTALAALLLFVALNLCAAAVKPTRLRLYAGYNNVDGRLERAIAAQGIEHGLVIFASQSWYDWGRSSRLAIPGAEGDLIFATSDGIDADLYNRYRGRPVYRWVQHTLFKIRE